MTSLFLMDLLLLIMAAAADVPSASRSQQDMQVAIEEMQRANHFTFVMLINMAPAHLIPAGNVTFLMPSDKTLSKDIIIPDQNSVADFLLRHSIPSPLLFEHLQRFPTGSIIPTSKPDLFLKIANQGRRRFFLNNVRIISPNICTHGSSIRCHGIDGVVQDFMLPTAPPAAADHCPNTTTSTGGGGSPPPSMPTEGNSSSTSSTTAVPPAGAESNKSSAPLQLSSYVCGVSHELVTACVMLLVVSLLL